MTGTNPGPPAPGLPIPSSQGKPYNIKSFPIDTALADFEWSITGDFVHAHCDGVYEGVGVRLYDEAAGYTYQDFDISYFNQRNPIKISRFTKLYVTAPAQAGKTLTLFVGREASVSATSQTVSVTVTQSFSKVRSDKDAHFTGAIAQNAKEDESLTGLLTNKIRITGITLQSDQALDYRLIFWSTDGFDNTDLDLDEFAGETELNLASYGWRAGGANQYYMDLRGLDIDYQDDDATNELHVSLQNLSATGKNAGATGEVVLEVTYEPRT